MEQWLVLVGVALSWAAVAVAWLWKRARPWGELDEVNDRLSRMEHRIRMTQGRLNSIAPPREGTGRQADVIGDPGAIQGPPVASRADVLKEWRRRNAK